MRGLTVIPSWWTIIFSRVVRKVTTGISNLCMYVITKDVSNLFMVLFMGMRMVYNFFQEIVCTFIHL